jgi:glycosyltransferase involved in cell wall biosynthesis
LVISLHGHEILRWFEPNSRQPTQIRTILQQADAITACSRYLLDKAIELEPDVTGKGSVIYNGFHPNQFNNTDLYAHPRSYILAYGRLVHHKGFDMLLAAFSSLARFFPEIDLILAGEGEEESVLQTQVQHLQLQDRVYFWGRATPTDVTKLLNGCQGVVIPSRREPFGIVALEAMAAGKPILATNVGGLPELLNDEVNYLVDPTVEALTHGLKMLLSNREALKDVVATQNQARATNFSWEKTTDQYLNVFQNSRHPT